MALFKSSIIQGTWQANGQVTWWLRMFFPDHQTSSMAFCRSRI
jgi:hypothetical protein